MSVLHYHTASFHFIIIEDNIHIHILYRFYFYYIFNFYYSFILL